MDYGGIPGAAPLATIRSSAILFPYAVSVYFLNVSHARGRSAVTDTSFSRESRPFPYGIAQTTLNFISKYYRCHIEKNPNTKENYYNRNLT